MTETPANTPKPIGSTSSFLPGGSKDAAAPAFSAVGVGEGVEDKEREESDKGNDEDGGKVATDEPVLSGCGVAVGLGIEETPITTAGTPEDDTITLLLTPVLLEGNDTELLKLGKGTEVSVIEVTGGELAGGKPVTVGTGETVLVETPVLERRSVVLEETTLGVDESVSPVPVNVGDEVEVDDGNCADTAELDPGGTALGPPPLPLSGLSEQVSSFLTLSTPSTTIGVKVIVHV